MKVFIIIILMLIVSSVNAQSLKEPGIPVKISEGSIYYDIGTKQCEYRLPPPALPVFVVLLRTNQAAGWCVPKQVLVKAIKEDLNDKANKRMSISEQKEMICVIAWLILLDYSEVVSNKAEYYPILERFQDSSDVYIRENAALVIKMIDLYMDMTLRKF